MSRSASKRDEELSIPQRFSIVGFTVAVFFGCFGTTNLNRIANVSQAFLAKWSKKLAASGIFADWTEYAYFSAVIFAMLAFGTKAWIESQTGGLLEGLGFDGPLFIRRIFTILCWALLLKAAAQHMDGMADIITAIYPYMLGLFGGLFAVLQIFGARRKKSSLSKED